MNHRKKLSDCLIIILELYTRLYMLERLLIAFAAVKAGNTSENLLNEIGQIIYALYRAIEITKKVYNNNINSYKRII